MRDVMSCAAPETLAAPTQGKAQKADVSIVSDCAHNPVKELEFHEISSNGYPRMAARAEKLDALAQFAAGFAHDFNNILAVIQGYGSLLAETPDLSEEVRKFIAAMTAAAQRGGKLTQQLMLFGGRHAMDASAVDLNEVATEITPMVKKLLGAEIETKVVPSPEPLICRIDPKMIQQVILAVAANAKEAMGTAGTFTLTLRASEEIGTTRACLTLRDTGCGMDQASVDKIFEPFFTTREIGRGSGLGLCAAYGIIKRHNGIIDVRSEPGQGTKFEIFLPLETPVAIRPDLSPLPCVPAEKPTTHRPMA